MGRPPTQAASSDHSGDLSWDEAIRRVLAEEGGPLHYGEITDRIIASQLRRSLGATPKDSVATTLSLSLRDANSRYIKVARGVYALRSSGDTAQGPGKAQLAASQGDDPDEAGAVQAFGMFWERASVYWGKPRLFGRQNAASDNIDFSNQVGVYLLHDRDRVVYVGRAGDSLAARLKEHTIDRLKGRWDRFSWFGLRRAEENAQLSGGIVSWTQDVVIDTMEALLIESIAPPLNRKRGDNFSAVEYLQAVDPQIEAGRRRDLAHEILKGEVRMPE